MEQDEFKQELAKLHMDSEKRMSKVNEMVSALTDVLKRQSELYDQHLSGIHERIYEKDTYIKHLIEEKNKLVDISSRLAKQLEQERERYEKLVDRIINSQSSPNNNFTIQ